MGKKDKSKNKGGAVGKSSNVEKKALMKHKKMLEKIGETDIMEIVQELEANEKRRQQVTEEIVAQPSPRSNFSFIAHPDKNELIMFGGEFFNGKTTTVYNELFLYNIDKQQWKKVSAPGGPGPRCSHQMVAVSSNGGELWIFGGEHSTPSGMQFYHYKDLWVYNLAQKTWTKVEPAGSAPSPRSGHRMTVMKKNLYIFGGFYDTGVSYKYFDDVWCFSLETYRWHEIKPSGMLKPAPRSACCMSATPDGKILVWGGYSKSHVKKDVDKGVTHTDMFAMVAESNENWKWIPLKPRGSRPAPRSGVSLAISANGNSAYSFGGVLDADEDEERLEGHFSDELLMFDLVKHKWWPVNINSTFGALSPSPRMRPGLAISKGVLYLYGGQFERKNKQLTLNDLYSLDINKLDGWKTLIQPKDDGHEWLSDSDSSDSENCSMSSSDDSSDSSGMDTE